jgi:acyl transferase domain-containing protein/acyl carrier protein
MDQLELSPEQRALLAMRRMKKRIAQLESRESEPIAIVGMACRFPSGVRSPEHLWEALLGGKDMIAEIPMSRFDAAAFHDEDPDAPWRMNCIRAGIVEGLEHFDAQLFGISPREAARLDPQQRMLLETTWEALERAGLGGAPLREHRVGVFLGISTQDYLHLQTEGTESPNAHSALGCDPSFAAGRLAFYFALNGPCLSLNTLCSSSLVAAHYACLSLRNQECDYAIVAGVNAILWPTQSIITSKFRALSPQGQCRTFDAEANGFVRGEGCGVVVLKPYSKVSPGERVLAVIRGSAVNHDGRGSGFTAPNGRAQSEVIKLALARAKVAADQVALVETHGTGTRLGDPIEAAALLESYGKGSLPCAFGAIKSNLGHTEAAAGIAGLIKVALALGAAKIPPNLHFSRLNPEIDLGGSRCFVPNQARKWPLGPRLAAVSSFGMSGTNAHVVLEAATDHTVTELDAAVREHYVVLVSAKTETALRDLCGRHASAISASDARLADLAFTLNERRFQLEERLCVVAADSHGAAELMRQYADIGKLVPRKSARGSAGNEPKIGFLFTGQSSQYLGMGCRLAEREPVFRAALERCDERLCELGFEAILPMLRGGDESVFERAAVVQPAIYAIECALVDLLASWGIAPQVVTGHSIGEYAAAYCARVFDWGEGLELVARRGQLMDRFVESGAMAAISAGEAPLRALLAELGSELEIAAVNSDADCVVAGKHAALAELEAECARRGLRVARLKVTHAFHSRSMDSILTPFGDALTKVGFQRPRCDFFSSKTGQGAEAELCSPSYWCEQLRSTVRFAEAFRAADASGVDVWVEVGAQPHLGALLARAGLGRGAALTTLRKGQDDEVQLLGTVAELAVRGAKVHWRALDGKRARQVVDLPTYPFERKRFWLDDRTVAKVPFREQDDDVLSLDATWQPKASSQMTAPADGGWLILASPSSEAGEKLARALESRGQCVVQGTLSATENDVRAAFEELHRAGARASGVALVVEGCSGDGMAAGLAAADRRALVCALTAVRAVKHLPGLRVHALTTRAQAVDRGESVHLAVAALWGFSRSVALEAPDRAGKRIDLDGDALAMDRAAEELLGNDAETDVAYRLDERFVLRLVRASTAGEVKAPALRADGAYLVTGGTGGLGLEFAEWLLANGAGRVVVASRRGSSALDTGSADRQARWQKLVSAGGRVEFLACDVTDAALLGAWFERAARDGVPLRGIIHAAGVASRVSLDEVDAQTLEQALHAKVHGAYVLHELSSRLELELFVLCSSVAGAWGAPLLSHYAAANAALDGLARHRRALGLPALSVQWGPWHSPGMASEEQRAISQRAGIGSLEPARALRELATAMARDAAVLAVAKLDLTRFSSAMQARGRLPLLEGLEPASEPATRASSAVLEPFFHRLPAREWRPALLARVREHLAAVLGIERPELVPTDRGLFSLGLDSLLAVELRTRLEAELSRKLPPTLTLDAPTAEALTDALLGSEPRREPARAERRLEVTPATPIAIVGVACRFPGDVRSPGQLWDLLRQSRDAIVDLPPRDWPASLVDSDPDAPGKASTLAGGYLSDVRRFDPEFFGITPREARNMDPQQRLLLEVSWEAIECSGHAPQELRDTRTGVFVGVGQNDYGLGGVGGFDPSYYASGNALSAVAGRLGYVLGLRGPCMAIDAACASSLVAVHAACQSLRQGESDVALAAGVNVILSPDGHVALTKAKMLSPNGRCMTFGAGANGYVRGEGCAVVVLKPLSRALADGDQVWAVIAGSSVNQNGTSSGFTVPSGAAQELVILDALQRAGVEACEVDYVEAHGTGTSLGDPIEVRALASAYGVGRAFERALVVGSIKSNIGHLEAAAGIAGLLKAMLALQRGKIPASLHTATLNPAVDWAEVPVRVARELLDWPRVVERRLAGVSSFGFSGTNAHVVLASAPAVTRAGAPTAPTYILKLSARTRVALWQLAARWAGWLASCTDADLPDLCATANAGRSDFEWRAAFVVTSLEQLRAELAVYSEYGLTDGERTFETAGTPGATLPESSFEPSLGRARELAVAYVSGATIPWGQLYPTFLRRELPTYPFQGAEHWLERAHAVGPVTTHGALGRRVDVAAADALYELSVSATEPAFMRHHRVFGRVVAPGTFHLALVLSAVLRESGNRRATLSGVAFDRPLELDAAPSTLQVALLSGHWKTFSRQAESTWVTHASGKYESDARNFPQIELPAAGASRGGAEFYRVIGEGDLNLGQSFRWIQEIRSADRAACATLVADPSLKEAELEAYAVFPGLLDSCFQVLAGAAEVDDDSVAVPLSVERLSLFGRLPGRRFQVSARLTRAQNEMFVGDVTLSGDNGQVLLAAEGLTVRRTSRESFQRSARHHRRYLARVAWAEWRPSGTLVPLDCCVIVGADPLATPLEHALRGRGVQVERAASEGAVAAALGRALEARTSVNLLLLAQDADNGGFDAVADSSEGLQAVVRTVQAAHALDPEQRVKVWFIASGVHATDSAVPGGALAAALTGFARAYRREYPARAASTVLVDTADPSSAACAVVARLVDAADDLEVAFDTQGVGLVACLERVEPEIRPTTCRPDASYLITGGTGALGLQLARRLVENGARHLLLISRSAPGDAASARIETLRRLGAEVRHVRADVTSRDDVRAVIASHAAGPPLRGIFHAAGALSDARLESLSPHDIAQVFAPKVTGAWLLHEASLGLSLEWFVLYSSLSALLGSVGQAHYAAANACLDALAQTRRRLGLPAVSLNFAPWAGEGMFGKSAAAGRLAALDPEDALDSVEDSLGMETSQLAILPPALLGKSGVAKRFWFTAREKQTRGTNRSSDSERFRELSEDARHEKLALWLRHTLGEISGIVEADLHRSLIELGLDSLMAVDLRNRIAIELEVEVGVTDLLSGPSLTDLANLISRRLSSARYLRTAAAPANLAGRWLEGEL